MLHAELKISPMKKVATIQISNFISATLAVMWMIEIDAGAAVTITFSQIGSDVVATTSGSIIVPSSPSVTRRHNESGIGIFSMNSLSHAATGSTRSREFGNQASPNLGTFFSHGLSSPAPTSSSGDTFGYRGRTLFLPTNLSAGEEFFPNTTFVWAGQTLPDLHLAGLVNESTLVYIADNGETITFAFNAIPEPTSIALLGASAVGILFRRRRVRHSS